ncbi:hypothetical protein RvY_05397 [Ramazzottius varieornatus]|uniref:Uncharacterized protein n=1 Tax=Ramazzottius varieornatus TaxID=947166 RepID=A0A1D1UXY7_RAMVA|nr:hypothetical protein RvY_05397 [Ramazzottius varieornatus]
MSHLPVTISTCPCSLTSKLEKKHQRPKPTFKISNFTLGKYREYLMKYRGVFLLRMLKEVYWMWISFRLQQQ